MAGLDIALIRLRRKKRPRYRIGYPSPVLVVVEQRCERTKQRVAFGAVVVNHPEAAISVAETILENIARVCDIRHHAFLDEELTSIDFLFAGKFSGFAACR